ncbi:hypothetical protein M885DRAFT_595659 [Pelagophyceae sp. CCMP2097]|nr:hypothetical protein M885DRAFT_595659 [Pelagophyceae sp. CCMP2097]
MFSLLAWAVVAPAAAYPWFYPCSSTIAVGEEIMVGEATPSDDRTVDVLRGGGEAVVCGGTYEPGEQLEVRLSSLAGHFILELAGATFDDGTCGGSRAGSVESGGISSLSFTAPADGDVTVVAAFALAFGGVSISEACTLTAAAPTETDAPTAGADDGMALAPTAFVDACLYATLANASNATFAPTASSTNGTFANATNVTLPNATFASTASSTNATLENATFAPTIFSTNETSLENATFAPTATTNETISNATIATFANATLAPTATDGTNGSVTLVPTAFIASCIETLSAPFNGMM